MRDQGKANWDGNDQDAQSKLILKLSDSLLVHVHGTTTTKNIWDKISASHVQTGLAQRTTIKRRYSQLTLPASGDLQQHISNLMTLRKQLEATGKTISNEDHISQLLQSPTVEYDPGVTNLEGKDLANLAYEKVIWRLLDHEPKLKDRKAMPTESAGGSGAASGVYKVGGGGLGQSEPNPHADHICRNCNQKSYLQVNCWAPGGGKGGGKATREQKRQQQRKRGEGGDSKGTAAKVLFILKGHIAQYAKDKETLIDSGLHSHLTDDENLLSKYID